MDGLTLTKVLNIYEKDIAEAGINRITLGPGSVFISMYNSGRYAFKFVLDGTPGVYKTQKAEGTENPVLKSLHGGKITALKKRKYDRLFSLEVKKRKPSGKISEYYIHFELAGRTSNMIVTDGDGKIIYLFNKNNTDPDRILKTGVEYMPFRANKRYSLDNLPSVEKFSEMTGFYKLTEKYAQKLMEEAGSFKQACDVIREDINTGKSFYLDEKGKMCPFTIPEPRTEISADDLEASTQGAKSGQNSNARLEDYKNILKKRFNKEKKRYESIIVKVQKELAAAEKHGDLLAEAELIKANLHVLLKAEGIVALTRYTETAVEEVEYKADPAINYMEKADKLFARGSRMKRSIPRIKERLEELQQNLLSIDEQIYFVEDSNDLENLMQLAKEMKKEEKFKKNAQVKESQFHKFDIGGAEAYVGKNSISNHRLVFQFASSSDMWLHGQKIPSAHCIIRSDHSPTPEQIETAARITASFSKQKNEMKVPVDYTMKKHVKKPKNTPPGFVIYHKFSTLTVQPMSEDELENMRIK